MVGADIVGFGSTECVPCIIFCVHFSRERESIPQIFASSNMKDDRRKPHLAFVEHLLRASIRGNRECAGGGGEGAARVMHGRRRTLVFPKMPGFAGAESARGGGSYVFLFYGLSS